MTHEPLFLGLAAVVVLFAQSMGNSLVEIGVLFAAIAAMWHAHLKTMDRIAKETAKREAESTAREERLIKAINDTREYHQTILVDTLKNSSEAISNYAHSLTLHTQELALNTQAMKEHTLSIRSLEERISKNQPRID